MQLACNGKNKCQNEIDLRTVLLEQKTNKSDQFNSGIDMPMRVILKCQHCAEGRVILTGDMFWSQHFEILMG
ncbi:MAG: hypothetical protein DWQ05_05385 [Calditrichaeota bacterium]|nr:MAG: hypothetical protein DWQ05_05385 [Calditrichota bacterium]